MTWSFWYVQNHRYEACDRKLNALSFKFNTLILTLNEMTTCDVEEVTHSDKTAGNYHQLCSATEL